VQGSGGRGGRDPARLRLRCRRGEAVAHLVRDDDGAVVRAGKGPQLGAERGELAGAEGEEACGGGCVACCCCCCCCGCRLGVEG
jgi:hypothetical protein